MVVASALRALAGAAVLLGCWSVPVVAADDVRLDGYAEWLRHAALIVDGQRVVPAAGARLKGARTFNSIPLGHEVKVKGRRQPDGSVLAREIDVKPNGRALFEGELRSAFDEREQLYRERRRVFDTDEKGRITEDYGRLLEAGPPVERVRRITRRIVPEYLDPQGFRVYVVDNKEWNAMAAPNGSIFVYNGLLADLDDDEIALVLGHELVHATHEHSRKQFKKEIVVQLAALGVVAGAQAIDDKAARIGLQALTVVGALAWKNGYGRSHEDQADRVGMRYAYEGGYAVTKGPALWRRFARKYGEGNRLVNFFFSDHSQSLARARNAERELALNYERR
jgi:Zn-dependent protease with chaperone function